jgi:outer membrane protein OmpA-like peptidoglycan-associated protein
MAENLIDTLQIALNRTFTGDVAKHLGESATTTRSALETAVPALLAGLLQRGATPAGTAELQRRVTDPQVDIGLASNIGSWLDGGPKTAGLLSQGSQLLSWLFGDRTSGVAAAIGSASGMKTSSASALLSLATPTVFALLKRYMGQNRLDAGGLASLLAGQRDTLQTHLSNGVSSALGFATPAALLAGLAGGVTGTAAAAAGQVADTARDIGRGAQQAAGAAYAGARNTLAQVPAAPARRPSWLWAALAAAAAVLIFFFSYWTTPVEQTTQTAQNLASSVGRAIKGLDLPGGMKIDVTAGGFVDTLTTFLNSKDVTLNRSFTFDELQFDPGSATLSPVSNTQLEQLGAVLKAYRTVLITVAGHTDSTGDPVANQQLSAQRAAAVKQALVVQGVAASRVTDEGFGSERPIASNDTEDGRAKNRRVELIVLKR